MSLTDQPGFVYQTPAVINPDYKPARKPLGPCQSPWGYHPCTYETYKRLRSLYKEFWVHVRKAAAAGRWRSKQPENRTGTCPSYCSKLVEKGGKYYTSCRVWTLFQAARRPNPHPVPEFTAHELFEIAQFELYLKAWNDSQSV